jgi:hypothetical protein
MDSCDHDLVDISDGRSLVNISGCLRCGCVRKTHPAGNSACLFSAARAAIADLKEPKDHTPPYQGVAGEEETNDE